MKPQQQPKMKYIAGYGLLRNQKFVEALLGRVLKSTETETVFHGYELRIVDREKLPLSVQEQTPPGFRLYGLAKGTPENKVGVRLLQLTEEEYKLIRLADFGDNVFKSEGAELSMIDKNYYFTHVLRDQTLGEPAEVSNEGDYELYLNGTEENAVRIAQDIRKEWLASSRSVEGKPHSVEKE